MKRLFLSLVLVSCASCCTASKVAMESIQDSWNAMRPYTIAGIQTATDLSKDAREELLLEVEELTKTINHEVSHASD